MAHFESHTVLRHNGEVPIFLIFILLHPCFFGREIVLLLFLWT